MMFIHIPQPDLGSHSTIIRSVYVILSAHYIFVIFYFNICEIW